MIRLLIWIGWCVVGFCLSMAGCHAQLSAEKLEASATIYKLDGPAPTTVEVHYDPNSSAR